MIKKKIFNKKTFWVVALIFCCILANLFSFVNIAFAEETVYSDVLSDLQKDENFNIWDYPVNVEDYSLKVIQVAESDDKELFVYVYQPTGSEVDLRATSINISTGINANAEWKQYGLTFLNSNGPLYKYIVEDFVVKEDVVRYYDVSSIFRKWIEGVDEPSGNDNTIDEVSFEVAQLWTACTLEGEVYYNNTETKVVEITGKYVGFIRYTNGFELYEDACDSHFVAFSTNYDIDKLYEADVDFVTQSFKTKGSNLPGMMSIQSDSNQQVSLASSEQYDYGDKVNRSVTVKYTDDETIYVGNIFHKKYSFNRIVSASDFLNDDDYDLSNVAEESVEGLDWVLRFYETDYNFEVVPGLTWGIRENGTIVSEVTIMRLKFNLEGTIYDLGVVDNKTTGSGLPSGVSKSLAWWQWALIGLACLLALPLIIAFLPQILSFVWFVIKCIAKAIWWLITAPFSIFR